MEVIGITQRPGQHAAHARAAGRAWRIWSSRG